ncbi:hypothetical protein HDV63DRAFT_399584 [Trichoderma sp. SZMC 28014]
MAGDEASLSRPSSSASSELPSLDDLIREQVIAIQIKQQQKQQQQLPDGGNRPTRESSCRSDVISITESDFANNNNNSSSIATSSRRSSTTSGHSTSGSGNNDISSRNSSGGGDTMDMDAEMSVNTTAQDDDNSNTDDNPPIPRLTSISPAVFVPISDADKLLQPLSLDPASPAYHRAALDLVTRHEASVRNNLNALFHREMFRVRADITAELEKNNHPPFDYAAARAHVRARDEDLLRRDCDAMIANMRARDVSKVKHGVTNIPAPNMSVPVTYAPVGSPREVAAAEIMKIIAAAAGDLARFDRHVRGRRATIEKQIQDAEAGAGQAKMDID